MRTWRRRWASPRRRPAPTCSRGSRSSASERGVKMSARTDAEATRAEARRLAGVLRNATTDADARSRGASERLARRAEEAGLIDVLWARTDTPIGTLLVAVSPRGLIRVSFPEEADVLQDIADSVSPRILHSLSATEDVRRERSEERRV